MSATSSSAKSNDDGQISLVLTLSSYQGALVHCKYLRHLRYCVARRTGSTARIHGKRANPTPVTHVRLSQYQSRDAHRWPCGVPRAVVATEPSSYPEHGGRSLPDPYQATVGDCYHQARAAR